MFSMIVPSANAANVNAMQQMINDLMQQIASQSNNSQTNSGLLAMINALQAQIKALQNGAVGTTTNPVTVPVGISGGVVSKFAQFSQTKNQLPLDNYQEILGGKIYPSKFDRNLNQIKVRVSPGKDNEVEEPWVAFDELGIIVNGYEIRSVDVDQPNLWRKVSQSNSNPVYELTIYQGNIRIPANSSPTFAADVEVNGDVNDSWKIWIPKNGITTWSKERQHVSFGPSRVLEYQIIESDVNLSGAIVELLDVNTIVEKSEVGADVGKFEFDFEITAIDEDIYLPGVPNGLDYFGGPMSEDSFLNFTISDASGTVINRTKIKDAYSVSVQTSASNVNSNGGYVYLVEEGETEDFKVTIGFLPTVTGPYRVALEGPLRYSLDQTTQSEDYETVNIDEKDFRSNFVVLNASSVSKKPTINGFTVSPTTVLGGQQVTLSWSSTGATACFIRVPGLAKDKALFGWMSPSGSRSYIPEWKNMSRVDYTLTCVDDRSKANFLRADASATVTRINTPASPDVPPSVASSTGSVTGVVQGATIDVYSQMAATIEKISELLKHLK